MGFRVQNQISRNHLEIYSSLEAGTTGPKQHSRQREGVRVSKAVVPAPCCSSQLFIKMGENFLPLNPSSYTRWNPPHHDAILFLPWRTISTVPCHCQLLQDTIYLKVLREGNRLLINRTIFGVSGLASFFTDLNLWVESLVPEPQRSFQLGSHVVMRNVSCIPNAERKVTEKQPSPGIATHAVQGEISIENNL